MQSFGTLNWIVLILYLLGMLLVGAYFARRAGSDQEEFFKAAGRLGGRIFYLCHDAVCYHIHVDAGKGISD